MHDISYQIRYSECDLFGHLNHTGYFDYLQEGLLAAGEEMGLGDTFMQEQGYLPLITGATMEYLRPLFFRQRIRLLPSLVEAGRYSCRLSISLLPEGSDKPAAHSEGELILLRDGEPAPLPEALKKGLQTLAPATKRLGLSLPDQAGNRPLAEAHTTERRVTSGDCNPSGLLSMRAGISFFEDCGLQQCNAAGWPFSRMAEEGIGIVSRKYTIRYLKPLPMDSRVIVRTWIHSPKGVAIERDYSLTASGDSGPAALAHCKWIFFDLKRQRPMRIPEVFTRDFGGIISTGLSR